MKFAKYHISILLLFAAISVGAQSQNVNQFLNSQLISSIDTDIEFLDMDDTFFIFDNFSSVNFRNSYAQAMNFSREWGISIAKAAWFISPVSDIPQRLKQNLHHGQLTWTNRLSVPVSWNTALAERKLHTPHPTSFDTGNIVQISPGSWIRVTKNFSFIVDLPLYFYSVNYSKAGAEKFRERVSIAEKSVKRGEFLPLIYQLKIGMGFDF